MTIKPRSRATNRQTYLVTERSFESTAPSIIPGRLTTRIRTLVTSVTARWSPLHHGRRVSNSPQLRPSTARFGNPLKFRFGKTGRVFCRAEQPNYVREWEGGGSSLEQSKITQRDNRHTCSVIFARATFYSSPGVRRSFTVSYTVYVRVCVFWLIKRARSTHRRWETSR